MDIDPTTVDPAVDPTAIATPGPIETQSEGSTSGSTQTVATPADRDAIAQQTAASMEAAKQQAAVGDAEASKSSQMADVYGEDAALARQQAADAAADHQDYLDRIQHARDSQQAAEDELKNHKYEDYWSKQSTGHRILHDVGSLMTGFSGNTAAVQALNESTQAKIKQDFDQQRADYATKLDLARMKGADVNDLYSQWERELGASKVKEAKAHEAVAAKALEIGTRAGIPVDQLKNNVLVQTMTANAQKARLESQLHFDRQNRFDRTIEDKVTDQKGPKGPTKEQRAADADLADIIPDATAAAKDPLSPEEMKALTKRLTANTQKTEGLGAKLLDKAGDLISPTLSPESEERVSRAQRLVTRLNPLVGEKKTPDSDVAVALSRLPTTEDKDSTKADRLLQTVRSQAYKTTNPAAFRAAATPHQAPAAGPAQAAPAAYSPALLAKAQRAISDPNAPPAAKIAAAKILDSVKN